MKKTKKKVNSNSTFPKTERLKSKKKIQELFKGSSSFFSYPIKILFLYSEITPTVEISPLVNSEKEKFSFPQVLISVPKRNFKHAVDRNRLKRQIKEAYRLNKIILKDIEKSPSEIAFLYVGKKKESYHNISNSISTLLKKLLRS